MSTQDQKKIIWLEHMLDTAISAYEDHRNLLIDIYNAFADKLANNGSDTDNVHEARGANDNNNNTEFNIPPGAMVAVFSAEESTEIMKQIRALLDNPLQLTPMEEMEDELFDEVNGAADSNHGPAGVGASEGQRSPPPSLAPGSAGARSQQSSRPQSGAPRSQQGGSNQPSERPQSDAPRSQQSSRPQSGAPRSQQGGSNQPSERPQSASAHASQASSRPPNVERTAQKATRETSPSVASSLFYETKEELDESFDRLPCEPTNGFAGGNDTNPRNGGDNPIVKNCCHPPPKGSATQDNDQNKTGYTDNSMLEESVGEAPSQVSSRIPPHKSGQNSNHGSPDKSVNERSNRPRSDRPESVGQSERSSRAPASQQQQEQSNRPRPDRPESVGQSERSSRAPASQQQQEQSNRPRSDRPESVGQSERSSRAPASQQQQEQSNRPRSDRPQSVGQSERSSRAPASQQQQEQSNRPRSDRPESVGQSERSSRAPASQQQQEQSNRPRSDRPQSVGQSERSSRAPASQQQQEQSNRPRSDRPQSTNQSQQSSVRPENSKPRRSHLHKKFEGERWQKVMERDGQTFEDTFVEETAECLSIPMNKVKIRDISYGSILFQMDADHDGTRRTAVLQEMVDNYPYNKMKKLYEIEEDYILAEEAFVGDEDRPISLNTEAVRQYNDNFEDFQNRSPPHRKKTGVPTSSQKALDRSKNSCESSHYSNPEANSFPHPGKEGGASQGSSRPRSPHQSRSHNGNPNEQSRRSDKPRSNAASQVSRDPEDRRDRSQRDSRPAGAATSGHSSRPRSEVPQKESVSLTSSRRDAPKPAAAPKASSAGGNNSRTSSPSPSQKPATVFELMQRDAAAAAARGQQDSLEGPDGYMESRMRTERSVEAGPGAGAVVAQSNEAEVVVATPYDKNKYQLRTASNRRYSAKNNSSAQMEKAIYGRRISSDPTNADIIPDLPEVEEFIGRENEELEKAKKESQNNYRRTSYDAMMYEDNKRRNPKEVGGFGRLPPGKTAALVLVEQDGETQIVVNPKPPKKIPTGYELQLQQEKTILLNQLEKLEFEYNFVTRKYGEGGAERRYAQLNHRIATVQKDLQKVEQELLTIENAELNYEHKVGSRRGSVDPKYIQ